MEWGQLAARILRQGARHAHERHADRADGWNRKRLGRNPRYRPTTVATTTSSGSTSEVGGCRHGAFGSTVMTQIAVRAVRKSGPVGTARFWIYGLPRPEKTACRALWSARMMVLSSLGTRTACRCARSTGFRPPWPTSRTTEARPPACQKRSGPTRSSRGASCGGAWLQDGVASLRDYFSSYTGYSSPQAAMEADIAYNRDGMVNEGLDPDGRGRKIYDVPARRPPAIGGAGDDTIINALTNCGMIAARRAVVENAIIANGGWSGAVMYLPSSATTGQTRTRPPTSPIWCLGWRQRSGRADLSCCCSTKSRRPRLRNTSRPRTLDDPCGGCNPCAGWQCACGQAD